MTGKDIREVITPWYGPMQKKRASKIANEVIPLTTTVVISARGITTDAFSTSSATSC
jgi:hypothetical protein